MGQKNEEEQPLVWVNFNERITLNVDELKRIYFTLEDDGLIEIDYIKAIKLNSELTMCIKELNDKIKEYYGTK